MLVHVDDTRVLVERLVHEVVDVDVDARVRDRDIEAPERLDRRVDGGPYLVRGRDVTARERSTPAVALDERVRRHVLLGLDPTRVGQLANVRDQDGCAFPGVAQGDRPAVPARRAGDQRHPTSATLTRRLAEERAARIDTPAFASRALGPVDDESRSRHVAREIGGEIHERVGDLLGRAPRPNGIVSMSPAALRDVSAAPRANSSTTRSCIGVSTVPGATQLTRTP